MLRLKSITSANIDGVPLISSNLKYRLNEYKRYINDNIKENNNEEETDYSIDDSTWGNGGNGGMSSKNVPPKKTTPASQAQQQQQSEKPKTITLGKPADRPADQPQQKKCSC